VDIFQSFGFSDSILGVCPNSLEQFKYLKSHSSILLDPMCQVIKKLIMEDGVQSLNIMSLL